MKSCFEAEKTDMRRNLYVISGPSGVGKDTVVKELLKRYPYVKKTVSVTTRQRRDTETDGIDYYYVHREKFCELQQCGYMVEYALYDGEYYGTLHSEIERHPANTPVILVIDVRGRRNVETKYPNAKSIFIIPPSLEALKERIISRKQNTPTEIERRLDLAKREMEEAPLYTYRVINDDIERCVEDIITIIRTSNVD